MYKAGKLSNFEKMIKLRTKFRTTNFGTTMTANPGAIPENDPILKSCDCPESLKPGMTIAKRSVTQARDQPDLSYKLIYSISDWLNAVKAFLIIAIILYLLVAIYLILMVWGRGLAIRFIGIDLLFAGEVFFNNFKIIMLSPVHFTLHFTL